MTVDSHDTDREQELAAPDRAAATGPETMSSATETTSSATETTSSATESSSSATESSSDGTESSSAKRDGAVSSAKRDGKKSGKKSGKKKAARPVVDAGVTGTAGATAAPTNAATARASGTRVAAPATSLSKPDTTATAPEVHRVDTEGSPPAETTSGKTGRRSGAGRFFRALVRPLTLVPLLIIVALLGVLAWGGIVLLHAKQDSNGRAAALDAGKRYATDIATYSYQNLDSNLAVVRNHSAGDFATQYQQVATNLSDLIKQYQSESTANVLQAGLVSGDRDNAQVIVFLDQTVTNTNAAQPRVDRNRMELSLTHEDGDWKLTDVQLL